MRHAFLIIAHNEYPVLKALLTMLDDARNDIYLHIDYRSAELYEQISQIHLQQAKLYLLPDRMKVYWGDISQVTVEYLLLETASQSNRTYAYYHLLSGTDLPLQSQDHIHNFFRQHEGCEFVGYWQGERHERDLKRKITRYYFFTRHLKRNHSPWHPIAAPLHNLALMIQKITGFRRRQELEFKKGPQWFSITHNFCQYLLKQKAFVMKRFRHTLCPDEIFVQTVLWNSPFRHRIYSTEDENIGNMRLIDWTRGNPYVWQEQDYEELLSSNKLFARKFCSGHAVLVQRLQAIYAVTKVKR